jgi:hypothetical protein
MRNKKSEGLKRQDAYVDSIDTQNLDFNLVLVQAFLKGIRDIGYKSTATALFENIDNAIQADAENIHIIFDFDENKSGRSEPDRIAIIDDGYGMRKEMIRAAVSWGGSDRINDREGMGRYGYGLPSSCVSIGESYSVYSKRDNMNQWYGVTVDLQKIANRDPDYMDKKGAIIAPAAHIAKLPLFVEKYLKNKKISLEQGTVILIDKIDRLSKKSFKPLKSFLSLETGITYRNFLQEVNIFIDGDPVQPVDPLFLSKGYRYYDENELRAQVLPPLEIKVQNSIDRRRKQGTIKVRFSYMPYGFLNGSANSAIDAEEDDDDIDEESKRNKSKRLTVRKRNTGIIFLRNGRQIDVVDSKCPWTKFQNNDRYVGVDVDFSAELDEEFSITTSKQQIVVSQRIWNILYDNGVYEAITLMRKRYEKESQERKRAKENAIIASPEKRDEFAEKMMEESAGDFETNVEEQQETLMKEAEENLTRQAKKISKQTGVAESIVRQELEAQAESRPYKLDYFDEPEGPFYRAEQVGGQVVVYINKAHRFYFELYSNPKTDAYTKNALALMIFVLGFSELRAAEEKKKWYKMERIAWSMKLESTLEILSKHFSQTIDDEVFEEEIRVNSPHVASKR